VDLPPRKRPIRCKWIFKVNHKPNDTIECIQYFETFSPVVKITTIRFILSLVSVKGCIIHQLDVNNVFLHGDLDEEIYMTPPTGLTLSHPMQVCKLIKSLYGLKQAMELKINSDYNTTWLCSKYN